MKFYFPLLPICILSFALVYSCSKENDEVVETQFICTVDYVEFISDVNANVSLMLLLMVLVIHLLQNILMQLKI